MFIYTTAIQIYLSATLNDRMCGLLYIYGEIYLYLDTFRQKEKNDFFSLVRDFNRQQVKGIC